MKRIYKKANGKWLLPMDSRIGLQCEKCSELNSASMGFFEAMIFTK